MYVVLAVRIANIDLQLNSMGYDNTWVLISQLIAIIIVMPKNSNIKNITITALFIILSYGLIRSTIDVYKGGQRINGLESEVLDLENRKLELEKSIEYKQTAEYIEEKARNDLNLVRPGESIFVVSGPGSEGFFDKKVLSGADKREVEHSKILDTNWYKWYKLFF